MTDAQQEHHTTLPGSPLPWIVSRRSDGTPVIGTPKPRGMVTYPPVGVIVAEVYGDSDDETVDSEKLARANARYIVLAANAYPSLLARVHALQEALKKLVEHCPYCDGTEHIAVNEHFVSLEMASDAGEPLMEGQSMGVEWTQCSYCGPARAALSTDRSPEK